MKELFPRRGVSRRSFLKTAAALVAAQPVFGAVRPRAHRTASGKLLAYVGTYTGAVGAGSNGEGIYRFKMNQETGELFLRGNISMQPMRSRISTGTADQSALSPSTRRRAISRC